MSEKWKIGERIENRFEISDIKRGGMGIVFLCYDHETKSPYAIKTFQDQYFQNKVAVDEFFREAETWVHLERHPNIVFALSVMRISDRPYIILELIAGQPGIGADLSDWIRSGSLQEKEALHFAIQFCLGMEYAAGKFREIERTFVHRDIKPQNIMITSDRLVKITDFGLVQTLSHKDEIELQHGSFYSYENICGTPAYMSPEQCRGDAGLDIRSDIYAFGCVLYEMFSGLPPFVCPSFDIYRAHHMMTKAKPLGKAIKGVSKPLSGIVMRCLEKDPTKRYPDFSSLRADLAGCYQKTAKEPFRQTLSGSDTVPAEWQWDNKGLALLNLKHVDEALDCFDKALEINSHHFQSLNNKGYAYLEKNNIGEALKYFDQALQIQPDNLDVLNNKAVALDKLERMEESLTCYDTILRINSQHAKALTNKGILLDKIGRSPEAISCLEKALEINPNGLEITYNLARVFVNQNRLKKALSIYEKAHKINPQNSTVLGEKGSLLLQMEEYKKALDCIETTLSINANDPISWHNRGLAMYKLGNSQEALASYDRALAVDPLNADTWRLKGFLLQEAGKAYEAIECFKLFIQWSADNNDPQVQKISGLVEEFNNSMKAQDPQFTINRGNALCQLNQYDLAVDCFKRGIANNERDADSWFGIVLAYHETKRYREALEACERFIKFAPAGDRRLEMVRAMIGELKSKL